MYNEQRFVAEAIRSVLGQTLAELEVIVIDDGSSDDSVGIVENLVCADPRVKLHVFENAGAGVARNRGLALATGEYVGFLDADDLMLAHRLERQLLVLRDHPELVAVGCLLAYFSADGRVLGASGQTPLELDMDTIARGDLMPFVPSAMVARTAAVREAGGFAEFTPVAEDLYLVARMARLGGFQCLREVLGYRRVHRASRLSAYGAKKSAARQYVQEALRDPDFPSRVSWERYLAEYLPSRQQRRQQWAQARYRQGAAAVLNRRWLTALSNLTVALMINPRATIHRAWSQLHPRANSAAPDVTRAHAR
jgi:glycosyltransferase involved in cell wall biosynthesis